MMRGGGRERGEKGGATCGSYPGALPRLAGGGYAHLCETEAGWGAGGRDHLSGDLRGPGSPDF